MKKLQKFIAPIIVLGLITAGVLYVRSWINFQNERNALQDEMDNYYEKQGARAAKLSLELAHPYLSDEDYGRYAQRVDALDGYYSRPKLLFDAPPDTYDSVMGRLGFDAFDYWAMDKIRHDNPAATNDREAIRGLLKTTPMEVIIEMHQPLQFIGLSRMRFYEDDFDDDALAEARRDFAAYKIEFEKAFAQANKGRG